MVAVVDAVGKGGDDGLPLPPPTPPVGSVKSSPSSYRSRLASDADSDTVSTNHSSTDGRCDDAHPDVLSDRCDPDSRVLPALLLLPSNSASAAAADIRRDDPSRACPRSRSLASNTLAGRVTKTECREPLSLDKPPMDSVVESSGTVDGSLPLLTLLPLLLSLLLFWWWSPSPFGAGETKRSVGATATMTPPTAMNGVE